MKSDVLIVGGGSTGLMISYYLLKKGVRSTIIERKYPGSGNTYKCATGIRASFTSREHIALMKRAIELWSELRDELGVFYERSGYLWLLSREEDLKMFKTYVSFQNELGVPTKVIDLSEVKRLAPTIVTKDLLAAVYDPLAGKASPFDLILRSWQ
ncbi:MAG: FAD-binding oxidoreductase, partial [Desulfurococcaceae archaeon]